jgi:hypothetical protein
MEAGGISLLPQLRFPGVGSAFESRRTSERGFTASRMTLRMRLAAWGQRRGRRQERLRRPGSEAPLLSPTQRCLPIWTASSSGAALAQQDCHSYAPRTAQSPLGPLWDAWADLVPVGPKGNLGRGCTRMLSWAPFAGEIKIPAQRPLPLPLLLLKLLRVDERSCGGGGEYGAGAWRAIDCRRRLG